MNAINIEVIAAKREDYAILDKLLGTMHEIFSYGLTGDLLRQVVVDGNQWIAILSWAPAYEIRLERDLWIGWHSNQRAERLKLVATNIRFVVNQALPWWQDYAALALRKALETLPDQWESCLGCRPLLAESAAGGWQAPVEAYRKNGWVNVMGSNRRAVAKLWLKQLDPAARKKLCAKPLQTPAELDVGHHLYGLLPIPDALLGSLKDALQAVPDPRADNRRFQIGSVLAIVAMALICGYNTVREMELFSKRLSKQQRDRLGLPLDKGATIHTLPGYFTFYRLYKQVDRMKVAEALLPWLNAHRKELPGVLDRDHELIRDAMYTLVFGYSPVQENQSPGAFPT